MERVEINGYPATADQLQYPAFNNYGHFTAMQVREREVRGLRTHLERLQQATRELFDTELDTDAVRGYLRQATREVADASVRVYVYWPDEPLIAVVVRPAREMPWQGQRLMSAPYQRSVPHIKHVGGFPQHYYRARAMSRGYDEALLSTPDGFVIETAVANIGFLRGSTVIWPDGPALLGTTQQMLDEQLARAGNPARSEAVRLADVGEFDGAFVANSSGIAPVIAIDDTRIADGPATKSVLSHFENVPWDSL